MTGLPAIAHATAAEARVIHALMLREVKSRFGRLKLGYLWAVLEPAAFVALFAIVFAAGHQTAPSGMPVVPFMITGFTPFFMFRSTMQQTLNAIEQNRVLLTFPQVTLFDLIFTRALLEMATLTVVFFLLLAAAQLLGFTIHIEDPLAVLVVLVCLGFTGLGIGAVFAALVPFFRSMPQIVSIIAGRPLFFTSGLFFTAEMLPEWVRHLLLFNPILQMIEWLRSAFFVEFESQYVSIEYVLGATVVSLFLGLLMLRGLKKRILSAV